MMTTPRGFLWYILRPTLAAVVTLLVTAAPAACRGESLSQEEIALIQKLQSFPQETPFRRTLHNLVTEKTMVEAQKFLKDGTRAYYLQGEDGSLKIENSKGYYLTAGDKVLYAPAPAAGRADAEELIRQKAIRDAIKADLPPPLPGNHWSAHGNDVTLEECIWEGIPCYLITIHYPKLKSPDERKTQDLNAPSMEKRYFKKSNYLPLRYEIVNGKGERISATAYGFYNFDIADDFFAAPNGTIMTMPTRQMAETMRKQLTRQQPLMDRRREADATGKAKEMSKALNAPWLTGSAAAVGFAALGIGLLRKKKSKRKKQNPTLP